MRQLQQIWRVPATGFGFLIFGLGAIALWIVLGAWFFITRPGPSQRMRLVRKAITRLCQSHIQMLKAIGLVSCDCRGFDGLSVSGKLIVANHPTLLDAVFLMALVPNATLIMKAAMMNNPFTGGIARLAHYIPNDEEGIQLLEDAVSALRRGESLVIFPAGIRSSGDAIKFKRGAANIALASGCRIVPVHIHCRPITLQKNKKWYHVPPRKPHFKIQVLPEFAAQDVIDTSRPTGVQARHLNRYLEACLTDREPIDELPANSAAGD